MGESFCLENDQAGQTGKILFYSFFNCLETLAHYAAAEKRKFVYVVASSISFIERRTKNNICTTFNIVFAQKYGFVS